MGRLLNLSPCHAEPDVRNGRGLGSVPRARRFAAGAIQSARF